MNTDKQQLFPEKGRFFLYPPGFRVRRAAGWPLLFGWALPRELKDPQTYVQLPQKPRQVSRIGKIGGRIGRGGGLH